MADLHIKTAQELYDFQSGKYGWGGADDPLYVYLDNDIDARIRKFGVEVFSEALNTSYLQKNNLCDEYNLLTLMRIAI